MTTVLLSVTTEEASGLRLLLIDAIIYLEHATMHSHLLNPIVSIALLALLPTALSHGHQVPVSDDADWATRHMAEEHHIANLDPSAFFTLHDYDSSGHWSADEIRRTYGLDDESAKDVPMEKKSNAVQEVIGMFDRDGDGGISREEWMDGWVKDGKRLPDFGVSCLKVSMSFGLKMIYFT